MIDNFEEILKFWFGPLNKSTDINSEYTKRWFTKSSEFDQLVRDQFEYTLLHLSENSDHPWVNSSKGRLACILCFDQFTRNIYRNTAQSFKYDPLALKLAMNAIEKDMEKELYPIERVFYYLPLEHAESREIQALSLQKFQELANEVPEEISSMFKSYVKYAEQHKDIVDRFGRFPHRNEILGRESTAEEIDFLKQPGSSF